jgi:hypothetical protein
VAGKRKLDVIEWRFRSYAEEITEWTQAILKEYSREQDEGFLRSLGIAPMQSSEGAIDANKPPPNISGGIRLPHLLK